MYRQPEIATVVAVQKSQPLRSVRQMYVTVRLERDGKELSFWWVSAPMVLTASGSCTNKAPQYFGRFWWHEDLSGQKVNLYHAGDESYTYMTFISENK